MAEVIEGKRPLAEESAKTQKAREKIRKQLEAQDLLITATALANAMEKIHQWIALNVANRVFLKNKEIRLFDQNQNAAQLSRKVQEIALKISQE